MSIGSLFSGIGGLELGLERSGLGPVIWQCEIDAWCRRVLAKHWPSVPRFEDVKTLGCVQRPAIICGGFPCQDVSAAGKGEGLNGKRSGLWYEFLRIVREMAPPGVIVENVASGKKRWLPSVREGLENLGYRTRAVQVSAFDVGAPHKRERVFVLAAHPDRFDLREQQRGGEREDGPGPIESADPGKEGFAPHADSLRELQPCGRVRYEWRRLSDGNGWQIAPPIRGVDDGVSRGLDVTRRLKALGNAVHPGQSEAVGRVFREWTGL